MAEVEKEQEEHIDMDVDSVNLHIPLNPVVVEPGNSHFARDK